MTALDDVLAKLDGARQSGSSWSAKCPAHDDGNPSLSITERTNGDPGVVVHCHAGCTTEAVTAAIGMTVADLFDAKPTTEAKRITATYDYHDAAGQLAYQVVRYDPKGFTQRRPDGRGGWTWNLQGVDRVLYKLPELLAADPTTTVFVVEGEKDVEALIAAGYMATCGPQGAGSWSKVSAVAVDVLCGRDVIVVADADDAGRAHARDIAASLHGVASDVTVVEAVAGQNDAAEHLGAGRTVDEFEVIASTDPTTNGEPLDDWIGRESNDSPVTDPDDGQGDDDGKPSSTLELVDWPAAYDGERRNDAIVDGLIIPGRWTALGAPGKVGKSTLELAIGVSISRGFDPFDQTSRDPVVVLYCDAEMGRLDVVDRLRTLDIKPDQLDRFHYTDLVPKLDIDQGAARLLATVEAIGAEVVIIDGINGFVEGPENDDTTWRHLFENAIAPLKRAGVAVLSADNLGKDKAKGLRGSTVKVDKPDAVIIMSRTDKGVRLTTTHRRTIDYPDQQVLVIDGLDGSEPIRYRHAESAWPAGTADAVALLDDLNIPDNWGRGKVRERLANERDQATPSERDRYMVRNDLLVAALAFRKKRSHEFKVAS